MNAKSKPIPEKPPIDHADKESSYEEVLDSGVEATFPASDPVAVSSNLARKDKENDSQQPNSGVPDDSENVPPFEDPRSGKPKVDEPKPEVEAPKQIVKSASSAKKDGTK